ncbi:MAG: TIGR02281 family clan AA aspartic protease [Alphaproteobacteria bacterium]
MGAFLRTTIVLAGLFFAAGAYLASVLQEGGGGEATAGADRAGAGRAGAAAPSALPVARGEPETHGSEIRIRAAHGGHFFAEAAINNSRTRFLVDTGATHIALSPEDAAAAGIRPGREAFTGRAQTANGVAAFAPVRLREVRLGSFVAYDVEAVVMEAPGGMSLLGMTFLRRLHGYEVSRDEMRLRW